MSNQQVINLNTHIKNIWKCVCFFGNLRDYTREIIFKGWLRYSPVFCKLMKCNMNFIKVNKVLKQNFSTNVDKLDPNWVTGFVDAEGCFSVIIEIPNSDLSLLSFRKKRELKWKVRISSFRGPFVIFTSGVKKHNLFVSSSPLGLLSKPAIRNFSTNNVNSSNYIKPEIIYKNADTQKSLVFKDNKGKSGIYRWINNLNGDSYVGSGVDLNKRLYQYYSLKLMQLFLGKRKSHIYSALIKYGYSNFTLEILEYCGKDKVIEREQYYLDLLKPKYNILSTAGSRFGFKHSDATREKMSVSQKGHKGSSHPDAKKLMVTDLETNSSTCYDSVNSAAKAIGCGDSSILKNLKSKTGKAYKGRYIFKLQ